MAASGGYPASAGHGANLRGGDGAPGGAPSGGRFGQQPPRPNHGLNGAQSSGNGQWGYQQGTPSQPNDTSQNRPRDVGAPVPAAGEDSQPPGAFPKDQPPADLTRRQSTSRICGKCGLGLTGQFVRALGDTYHLECFTCHVSPLTVVPARTVLTVL